MNLESLKVYEKSMDLGEEVWAMAGKWNFFEKDTIGKQLVRSANSIAANISEGYGRFHYKDSKKFYYYSRGSLYETKTWIRKANNRDLVSDEDYSKFVQEIELLGKMLNAYIKSIGK